MKSKFEQLKKTFTAALADVKDGVDLEEVKTKFLGRKGHLALLMKELAELAGEERREIGQIANETKKAIEEGLAAAEQARRTVTGFDLNRAQMLIAAIEKSLGLRFDEMDVFASLQGGIKFKDPALDLAFCAALISSAKDMPLPPDCAFMGEVGILAQVTSPAFLDRRLAEAERLGFKKAFVARAPKKDEGRFKSLQVEVVKDIGALYAAMTKLKPAPAPAAAKK